MTLQAVIEAQEVNRLAGGCLLGTIFGWDLNADFRLNQQQFLAQAQQAGIPDEFFPATIEAKDAFRKATRAARPFAHQKGWQLDVIENKGEEYIIGLSSKSVDKEASIKVIAEYAGDIELDDWNLVCNLPINYLDFEAYFQDRFEFYQEFTHESVREMLCKFVKKFASRLNKRGGSYFVPVSAQDSLERITAFLEAIAAANGFDRFELYGSVQNNQQVAQALNQNFEVEIAQLLQETQAFIASADPLRKTYDSSLNRRQEEVAAIQERLKLFEEVLSVKADELRINLGQVSRLVLEAEVSQFCEMAIDGDNPQAIQPKYGDLACKLSEYPDLKAQLERVAPLLGMTPLAQPFKPSIVPIAFDIHPDVLAAGF